MALSFHAFADISPETWLTLLNHPAIRRHMPLAGDRWTAEHAREWAKGKDAQWQTNGYGPWAIKLDGQFAGWGGFQKEGDDADFGLVLLPNFWGHGFAIHQVIVQRGFVELGLGSITILLPPTRTKIRGLARIGYEPDGEVAHEGNRFLKFRLRRRQMDSEAPVS